MRAVVCSLVKQTVMCDVVRGVGRPALDNQNNVLARMISPLPSPALVTRPGRAFRAADEVHALRRIGSSRGEKAQPETAPATTVEGPAGSSGDRQVQPTPDSTADSKATKVIGPSSRTAL